MSTKSLAISALNLSNVDIGMFAVINPVTGEQVNIDSLAPGESVSLESNCPTDIEAFHWVLVWIPPLLFSAVGEPILIIAKEVFA